MKRWIILAGLIFLVLVTPKPVGAIEIDPLKCGLPQFLTEIQAFGCSGSVQCHGTNGVLSQCCRSAADCPENTYADLGELQAICGFPSTTERNKCTTCMQGNKHIWTAIGCLPSDPAEFVSIFLRFAVGISGGIAFLLIIFGGFQILTSAGNPEQLNASKELVGSAIAGLLLIIFSIFLLRLIGYNILGLPGFG